MELKHYLLLLFLKISSAAVLAAWACVWILKPTQWWKRSWHAAEERVESTFLGGTGINVVVFCFPLVVAAALAYAYLSLRSIGGKLRERRTLIRANFSRPVIISHLIGIVSVGEMIAVLLFVIFLAWTYYSNVSSDLKKMTPSKTLKLNRKQLKMMSLGVRFGSLSEACLAVLLLPILRGMSLLTAVGIQFEASVKYHIWVANGMMISSLLHGVIILSVWGERNSLWEEVTKWQRTGRVYLAGAITLVIGLSIWITAMPPIRRKYFHFFYSAHHLYVLFIFFFLLHAGDRHFYTVISGILLFSLDRILRLLQSTRDVSLLSARVLPCRAVELTLSKHPGLKYSPTSTLFVKIPSISDFQWHPFSIVSSSNVDDERLSVLVKCQGRWTNSLYNLLESMANSTSDRLRFPSISVEGPYGPTNFPYQRYDKLILIAGGSGITPFLSILQDMASRNQKTYNYTAKIHLIYVVRKLQDLSMLATVSSLLINHAPQISELQLNIYVTRDQGTSSSVRELIIQLSQTRDLCLEAKFSKDAILGPEGLIWKATITGLALIVFFISILCLTKAFVHEQKRNSLDKTPSWVYDLLVICSFIIAITSVIVATMASRGWRCEKDASGIPKKNSKTAVEFGSSVAQDVHHDYYKINFGRRPNLEDILSEEHAEAGESHVGVFVSGPHSMQESVASFCRKCCKGSKPGKNGRKKLKCSFVYNSISFSL
ncbi:Ferric reduction oxidase 8, mitochondrial [Apostasia shenzhenica]|uniref:Ferric reduction oxidase 8, mitochondrial n=1 Tax=Apostasia shenzhenica TaxID=1088818 RepID=A0A2I0AQG8_9ASPA|nr:Ferric reduction oxidase 8, mitochondrial [Apostasia shenzhenica]